MRTESHESQSRMTKGNEGSWTKIHNQAHAPQPGLPLLVGKENSGALLADALEDLNGIPEVSNVKDWELQTDVT